MTYTEYFEEHGQPTSTRMALAMGRVVGKMLETAPAEEAALIMHVSPLAAMTLATSLASLEGRTREQFLGMAAVYAEKLPSVPDSVDAESD